MATKKSKPTIAQLGRSIDADLPTHKQWLAGARRRLSSLEKKYSIFGRVSSDDTTMDMGVAIQDALRSKHKSFVITRVFLGAKSDGDLMAALSAKPLTESQLSEWRMAQEELDAADV